MRSRRNARNRLAALYGMNSTSKFPPAKRRQRPKSANPVIESRRKRREEEKRRQEEEEEKKKHAYSYWRLDTALTKKFHMLNNVESSPRDSRARENAMRENLHGDKVWRVGYQNRFKMF